MQTSWIKTNNSVKDEESLEDLYSAMSEDKAF